LIRVLLLPDRKHIVIDRDRVAIRELLGYLGEEDLESLAIVVNGKLVESVDYIVKSDDEVVVIKQATGG